AVHVVAGGTAGVLRVWQLDQPSRPVLQASLEGGPRSRGHPATAASPITSLCCFSQNNVLVGTDAGTLAFYSLKHRVVSSFSMHQEPKLLKSWKLKDPRLWGGRSSAPGWLGASAGSKADSLVGIVSLERSPGGSDSTAILGLRNGCVLVFDIKMGRVMGCSTQGNDSTSFQEDADQNPTPSPSPSPVQPLELSTPLPRRGAFPARRAPSFCSAGGGMGEAVVMSLPGRGLALLA
ncbi:unnamed protein product, partial [Discosporangium mesarthrocarpum]